MWSRCNSMLWLCVTGQGSAARDSCTADRDMEMGLLIAGVVTSRFGLWMFDLAVSQMLLERVDPNVRCLDLNRLVELSHAIRAYTAATNEDICSTQYAVRSNLPRSTCKMTFSYSPVFGRLGGPEPPCTPPSLLAA